jgi:hypothetical protein
VVRIFQNWKFLVFGLDILIFTKLMLSNIIWKENLKNQGIMVYLGICSIIKFLFFWIELGLGLN